MCLFGNIPLLVGFIQVCNVVVLPPGAAGTMYLQFPPTGGQYEYNVVVLPRQCEYIVQKMAKGDKGE